MIFFWRKAQPDDHDKQAQRATMLAALRELVNHHALLTVQIDDGGDSASYSSLLLKLVRSDGPLLMDALQPESGNQRLQPGTRLHIQARPDGVPVRFTTTLLASREDEGGVSHELALPESINRRQQRANYRFRIPVDMHAHATVQTRDDTTLDGRVVDVSLTGLRLGIKGFLRIPISTGDPLNEGRLQLPNLTPINFRARIRFHHYDRDQRLTLIGMEFQNMAGGDERALARFVTDAQRERQRTRTRE